jgi:hypothetical protein
LLICVGVAVVGDVNAQLARRVVLANLIPVSSDMFSTESLSLM